MNRLIPYAYRQTAHYPSKNLFLSWLISSHIWPILSAQSRLCRPGYLHKRQLPLVLFNFIHAFLVSCYLNACQMAFPTSFLTLQKVGWNTFKLNIAGEGGWVDLLRYQSLLMQSPRRTNFMSLLPFPLILTD